MGPNDQPINSLPRFPGLVTGGTRQSMHCGAKARVLAACARQRLFDMLQGDERRKSELLLQPIGNYGGASGGMADTPDLGSGPARGGGSSPLSRTKYKRGTQNAECRARTLLRRK